MQDMRSKRPAGAKRTPLRARGTVADLGGYWRLDWVLIGELDKSQFMVRLVAYIAQGRTTGYAFDHQSNHIGEGPVV